MLTEDIDALRWEINTAWKQAARAFTKWFSGFWGNRRHPCGLSAPEIFVFQFHDLMTKLLRKMI